MTTTNNVFEVLTFIPSFTPGRKKKKNSKGKHTFLAKCEVVKLNGYASEYSWYHIQH